MARFTKLALAVFALSSSTSALPLFGSLLGSSNTAPVSSVTTELDAKQIADLVPFANFARASFCSPAVVQLWKCGPACDAEPQTQTLLAGGDDAAIPDFYVAFDPPSNSIVVAHQGTQKKNILSILNDVRISLVTPNQTRFPGTEAKGVKIHDGFLSTFERTADQILAVVQNGIKEKKATNVRVTGHSLGAAIALLDATFLRMQIDPKVTMETVIFGLPRVGNQQFADLVDAMDSSISHVVNADDPVPLVPPTFLGFRHPAGEIFQHNGKTVACQGQENSACSTGASVFASNVTNHDGPYAGVELGNKSCPL